MNLTEKLTECEKLILWLAQEQLGMEWTGKRNPQGEFIMYTSDGGREPYSLEALKADLFPITQYC